MIGKLSNPYLSTSINTSQCIYSFTDSSIQQLKAWTDVTVIQKTTFCVYFLTFSDIIEFVIEY